jgi:hypothetical protein
MMNAHMSPQDEMQIISQAQNLESLQHVALGSLRGELLGHMAGVMYDDSCPEQAYVGGAQKWSDFVRKTKKYKFLENDEALLRDNGEEMAETVLTYREGNHHLHFFSLAPGSKFADKDYHAFKAFNDAAQQMGHSVLYSGLDINFDFAAEPMGIIGRECTNVYASNRKHDMYTNTISDALKGTPFERNDDRTSVVLYTGGTVGNIATKSGDVGFPHKGLVRHLQDQVDAGASESYLIVCHNAQTEEAVLENYSESCHSRFALSGLHQISFRLTTSRFNPDAFKYSRFFDPKTGLVGHQAVSKTKQSFKVAGESFSFEKGETVMRVGNSYQISNNRMGEVSNQAGFIRVASFRSPDTHTIYQVLKASETLMQRLRGERGLKIA